jgi:uncharacterized DUF497 family protein
MDKVFLWSPEKNEILLRERGIGFEEITELIAEGHLLRVLEHPNRQRHPNQKMFEVDVQGYVHLVPFVESEQGIFLKTIFPSRKATRARRRNP